jgi:hypothetical protein
MAYIDGNMHDAVALEMHSITEGRIVDHLYLRWYGESNDGHSPSDQTISGSIT